MARKRTEARSIVSAEGAAPAPVTHRRTVRPSAPPAVSAPPAAAVATPAAPVSDQDEIGKLAYSYWEARGCQGGSPEEDWARAEEEIRRRKSGAA